MADTSAIGSITHLDTSALDGAKEVFEKGSDTFSSVNQSVKDATTALLQDWKGDGKYTFKSKYDLFSKKIDDLQDVLKEYSEAIGDALESYEQTDRSIADMINSK